MVCLSGCERWVIPARGAVSPSVFMGWLPRLPAVSKYPWPLRCVLSAVLGPGAPAANRVDTASGVVGAGVLGGPWTVLSTGVPVASRKD